MANTPRYVTSEQVRTIVGLTTTQISDDDYDDIIYDIEFQIERYLNTSFTPKQTIDILDGTGKATIFTTCGPLLTVRTLKDDTTTHDTKDIQFTRPGRIRLTTSSTATSFKIKENNVIIEYYFGRVEFPESGGTETTTDTASTEGTSTALSVASESGFAANDWVEIIGTDGNREASKVASTASGTITVDETIYNHVSGSLVRKLQIPNLVERLIKISAALAGVARQVGQSAEDIVGYTMGQFSVQKGEPYTQWRETALQLINERDEILEKFQPTAGIVM